VSKKNAAARVRDRALFRVRTVRFFPARSLAYALIAATAVFLGLLAADRISGYEQQINEDFIGVFMNLEKLGAGLEYPLMEIKGRQEESRGHVNILVLGDSFVWGEGLTNLNQIWWSVMARELERRGYDCQVRAVGEPAVATLTQLGWLKETPILEDIRPDLIVIGYVTNDADLSGAQEGVEFMENSERFGMIVEYYNSRLWDEEKARARRMFPNTYALVLRKLLSSEYGNWEEAMVQGKHLERYDQLVLQPLGELVARAGIPAIVIPTPETPRGKDYALLYRDVLPLFERAGLPVYNPLEQFIEKYPGPNRKLDRYFRANESNPHPGPATSFFLGKYAADVVEQNYAAMLGEKKAKDFPIEINDWMPYMLDPRTMLESDCLSRYAIEYPDQSSRPDFKNRAHGNFLTLPLREKYVKLNFKNPVRLSRVTIEGEDLLSCEVWSLGINRALGFDDQKPVSLGRRKGSRCAWDDNGQRDVTSLLVSAKTVDGRQASLTVTIEGEVAM